LQFHNCYKNIYYENLNQKEFVDSISKDFFLRYKKEEQLALTKEASHETDPNRKLLIFSSKGIPEKMNFSFLKYGNPKRKVFLIRNKELSDLFKEKANSLKNQEN
jgi:hypothetical protein